MERMRRNSSLKRAKPKSRKWLYMQDISCCSNVFLCMKKPFKSQSIKWWSFKKSSTDAAMQGTSHNTGANSSFLSNAAYRRSWSMSRQQYMCSDYKKKQALAVAVATVAAAEAAVVAAEAAAHMAQLTVSAASRPRWGTCSLHAETLAAIKIQSAFRGYSVRKAITVKSKAGLVRLQALAHGKVGQTQCVTTMRCMQAFVREQRAGVRRQPCKHQLWVEETPANTSTRMRNSSKEGCHESAITHAIKEDSGLAIRHCEDWDKSTKTLEGIEARREIKLKAALKRERAMAYNAFLHQKLTKEEVPEHRHKDSKLHWNWLERWMASRLHGSETRDSTKHAEQVGLLRSQPPKPAAKRPPPLESWSLRARRYQNSSSASSNASSDVQSVASFSGTPSYMGDTESTRAKVRAHSAPRQRLGASCITLSNGLLQQQPYTCARAHHSSFYPRHLSHMSHSHASTNTKF